MRYFIVFAGLVAVLLAGCAASRPAVEEPPISQPEVGDYLVAGYHPYWMQDAWRSYDASVFDEIYFFSIEIDSTGNVAERNGWPDRWFVMQQELVQRGLRVSPVVALFSQRAFERLFATPSSSEVLLETLLGLLNDSPAVGGIQLDFEIYQPVSASVRGHFTEFVGRLREEMQAIRADSKLSLYVLAYDASDVIDEAALARHVDYFVVQGYDLHGRTEDRTGPVAGLDGWGDRNWKHIVQRLSDLGVPSRQIVMSVPYFGYEWPAESDQPGARTTGSGVTLSYAPVDPALIPGTRRSALQESRKYGLRRDSLSGSPYYAFQDSAGWRQGWFEDAESLRDKYEYVQQAGLRGVAIFPPAYGSDELEAVLREFFSDGSL